MLPDLHDHFNGYRRTLSSDGRYFFRSSVRNGFPCPGYNLAGPARRIVIQDFLYSFRSSIQMIVLLLPGKPFIAASPQNRTSPARSEIWSAVCPGVFITPYGKHSALNCSESMETSLFRYSSRMAGYLWSPWPASARILQNSQARRPEQPPLKEFCPFFSPPTANG